MMTKQQYCPKTEASSANYQAHSAPIGFVFYNGDQFPAAYKGDAFVAFRGSWNRDVPTGYKIVRVHFGPDGTPTPNTVDNPMPDDMRCFATARYSASAESCW